MRRGACPSARRCRRTFGLALTHDMNSEENDMKQKAISDASERCTSSGHAHAHIEREHKPSRLSLIVRRTVKFIVMTAGIITLIALSISLTLQMLGESRLEWTDGDRCGNGYAHKICDDEEWPIVYFRLSDYSSTNNTYLLEIMDTCLYTVKKHVKATRYNAQGDLVAEGDFQFHVKGGRKADLVELPSAFTPQVVDETLVLEFYAMPKQGGDSKEMQVRFSSKKMYYSLCV